MNAPATVETTNQPFQYPLTRLPGYQGVSREDWESALWQRKHTVKNLKEFKAVLGHLLPDTLLASIARDHEERATMSMLLPPQMINTMNTENL